MPYSQLTNAIIGGSEQYTDHDIAMLQKEVSVRDGDDAIHVEFNDEPTTVEEQDDGRTEITLNTETGEVEGEHEENYEEEEGEEAAEESAEADEGSDELELPEFHNVDPKDLNEAADLIQQAQAGQDEMFEQAVEKGLDASVLESMKAHYVEHGELTEAHYEALAEVGYTKSFINSYIRGQDAVAAKYAKSVMDYVGGEANFHKVTDYMAAKQPHMVDAFNAAVERYDVNTMRALLDACKTSMGTVKQTTAPKRNLAATAKAKPVKAQVQVQGYKNRAEMVKDMSDPRYGRDADFRRQVELKVMYAHF